MNQEMEFKNIVAQYSKVSTGGNEKRNEISGGPGFQFSGFHVLFR